MSHLQRKGHALNLNTPIAVAACVALVCSVVFFLESSGYVGERSLGVGAGAVWSEPWRLITFMFTHDGIGHLLANLVGLSLVGILAWQLEVRGFSFFAVFVGAGILATLPTALLFSQCMFVGASGGIFGLFGYISVALRRHGFPILSASMVFVPAVSTLMLAPVPAVAVHLLALATGAGFALSA